jgi:hypothetical protein
VPVMRHNLFVRTELPQITGSKLKVVMFANVSLPDRSALLNIEFKYPLSESIDLGISAFRFVGDARSVYGSLPYRGGASFSAKLYF